MGSFEGWVVLVTGAGRGIGRAEALHLAELGAMVVVNDTGGASDGSGGDAAVAAAVAEEIVAAGGRAVASTDSVADWAGARRMVQTAVDAFGDLHAVINNAAVERSRALVAMTEDEFDDVVAVKLKGAFAVTRWAARYWRDRAAAGDRTDRAVVNTTSGSGLLNPLPGQSNYAAANAAVAALTVVHALELRRFGVRVNALSPSMVRTRLTEGVPGMEAAGPGPDPRDPAVCAPVAAYLAAPGCPLTGQVLSVRGSTVAVNHGWSLGQHVTKDEGAWTVEELARALPALEHRDPFDALAAALGGALGAAGRADVERLIDTMLDTALDTALDGAR